ncbi:MAG TPA: tetratricopeptide repeat protein [Chitinophagales bacterium]|nr:tetratricopeptide repeat protein [Chitinophagales bacterium]
MNRHYITNTAVAILLGVAITTTVLFTQTGCTSNGKSNEAFTTDAAGIPNLVERQGKLAEAAEWEKTKLKVTELKEKIAQNPNDVKPRLQLAMIYMNEARITGNADYHQGVVKILDDVIAVEPNNFEAHVFKAGTAMSLHQFKTAEALAEKAKSINPDNAYVYGILVDANVELGRYDEAVAAANKMQELKPSLEAYARVSYLREIFGDYDGAIEAMKMAVEAGAAGMESAEWARVALGDLYLNTGKLDEARAQYEAALHFRPNYPAAEIGLAKVEKANKNYDAAIGHTENAIRVVSESFYVAQLGELYALKGDEKKAQKIRNDVVKLLEQGEEEQENAAMKHNSNRELAFAYLDAGKHDKALEHALNDLNIRPDNIDANELVAWINYEKGDYAAAKTHAAKMLRTNTRNANTLYKASLIYARAGDAAKAAELQQLAQATSPFIDQRFLLASR